MAEIVEDTSEIVDNVLDFIVSFVKPLLEVSSCAEMPLSAASQDDCPQLWLFIDLLNSTVELRKQINRKRILLLWVIQLQFGYA